MSIAIGHALRDGLAGQAPLICNAFVWTQCAPVGAAAVFHVMVVLCNGGVVVLYVVTLHGMIFLLMSLRPGRRKDVLEGWVTRGRVFVA